MALDFPPGTPGATYTGPNGVIWSWDGAKWISGTGTTVYAPITDPVFLGNPQAPHPAAGDADASIATTKFVSDAVATSLHDVGRNYLHNSMMNVAQRGVGPFTGLGAYTLDRWFVSGVSDTVSVTQQPLGDPPRTQLGDEEARFCLANQFTGNAAAGAYNVIYQGIENIRRLAGKTVTISFWATAGAVGLKLGVMFNQVYGSGGSPSAAVTTTAGSVTTSMTFTRYSLTVTLPSSAGKTFGTNNNDATYVYFAFSSGATNNALYGNIGVQSGLIWIWGVQLELGTVATPLEKLDPVTQWHQCQRFYCTGQLYMTAQGWSGGQFGSTVYLPVTMRGTPQITLAGAAGTNVGAVATYQPLPTSFIFQATPASTGQCGINQTFTASADL